MTTLFIFTPKIKFLRRGQKSQVPKHLRKQILTYLKRKFVASVHFQCHPVKKKNTNIGRNLKECPRKNGRAY